VARISQELIDSTFFLYKDEASARAGGDARGTGFVVSHKVHRFPDHSNRETFTHYYAVTNAHVAKTAPVLRLNIEGRTDVFAFDDVDWDYHPGGDDIAIVPLRVERGDAADGWGRPAPAINTAYFHEHPDRDDIGVGDDVFMIGLFVDHEGRDTNNPMARFGNISMMADENSKVAHGGKKLLSHIIDMHSRTGFSGSPVFVYRTFGSDLRPWSQREDVQATVKIPVPSPQQIRAAVEATRWQGQQRREVTDTFPVQITMRPVLRLLGIHWGQFPERWDLKNLEEATRPDDTASANNHYIDGVSGMTLVAPASKIMDLLEMPMIDEKRMEAEKKTPPRKGRGVNLDE
jgi:hypothetical protein